jgi:hypothetical protein
MSITKESILSRTHYGLNIYSYVLQQFHPNETVLHLSGRECLWIKNPFTGNQIPSLRIRCINNVFMFEDEQNPNFKGDPFDFAELHFKLSGNELLVKLNECLFLMLDKKRGFYDKEPALSKPKITPAPELNKQETIIPVFSYFNKPIANTQPAKIVNLLDIYRLVKGDTFKTVTEKLRSIPDKGKARNYKTQNFDYVTFSGTFSKREDKALIKHSGLITIDFDHVQDLEQLKLLLLKDEYFETELLFTSPSGDGLKWIIPVDTSRYSHAEYFEGIQGYIGQTYNLQIDKSGRDISRACFLVHDNNIFINPKYLQHVSEENL